MTDYNQGKIYTINNMITQKIVYVGSTCKSLKQRMARHKVSSKEENKKHLPLYQAFEEFGIESFSINLFKNFPSNNKLDLETEEGKIIRELNTFKNGFNTVVNKRTKKERYQDFKEDILTHNKAYYEKNKDKIKVQKENYNKVKIVCPLCNREMRRDSRYKHNKALHENDLKI